MHHTFLFLLLRDNMLKNVKNAVQVFTIIVAVVQPSLGMPRWLDFVL